MFGKEKAGGVWPAVPPSLNHNSFELQDAKARSLTPPPPDTAGSITPYLGLRARLSQIWFNRWTVLLILVLVRVLILIAGLNDDIGDAKVKALSACTKVEDIGSAMASMPHYLSVGVNSVAAQSITKAVHAMAEVLMMMLTGVEQLILFVINFIIGTYVCLTSALIHGGLEVAISAVTSATDVINKAITDITNGLNNDIAGVQKTINDILGKINNLPFGSINIPKIDISGRVTDLRGIKVNPTDFVQSLVSLNQTIPTYDDARNLTEQAIAFPFNLVREAINTSYSNYQFDKSVFPVAKKEALSFCSTNSSINDFFENLYKIAAGFRIGFIVVITVLAVLACVAMSYLEIRRYRRQQRSARLLTKHGYDPMDVVYIASRPHTATWGIKLGARMPGRRQILVRWAVAYGTSMPALFVLSLALAGFFSCLCQFILLRAIQKEAPALANQVGNFAGEVVTTLEDVSVKWAADANGVITGFTDDINQDLLGHVTNATSAVNNTLNTFTSMMNDGLDKVFGQTVLENPIRQVVRCLIGLKIEAVEKGLTWVHDHAHVSLPLFPNDTFSQGAQKSIQGDSDLTSFLASPSSVTTDEITGAIEHVVNFLHNNLVQEALISTGLLLVYLVVVLVGIVRMAMGMVAPDRTRAEGGQRFFTGDGREPPSPRGSSGGGGGSGSGARFPAVDGGAETARHEDAAASPRLVKSGSGGLRSPGHWRDSSHGHLDDARR